MEILNNLKRNFSNKKVLILGLGLQGGGVQSARFFAELGAKVTVTDLKTRAVLKKSVEELADFKNIEFVLGENRAEDILASDYIIRNPGVKRESPLVKLAIEHGKTLIMETALFMKYCSCFTIGVTGTRGKSTTTHLIYEILKTNQKRKVYLAGNIPQKTAITLLKQITKDDIVVLELSSWQLQGFADLKVSPNLAVFTNIYPDHLNFYNSMDEYFDDKLNIIRFQKNTDILVSTNKLENEKRIKENIKGKSYFVSDKDYQSDPKYLIGKHNLENAALALKVAEIMNIDSKKSIEIINNYHTLPFRLEYLGTLNKCPFFNDSTSTTPIACQKAIEAMKTKYGNKRKLILILGGNSKNLPFGDLINTIINNVHSVFLLNGTFTDQISTQLKKLNPKSTFFNQFPELFNKLITTIDENSIVLLSPGATSFAGFNNEFDRGEKFSRTFHEFKTRYETK